MSTVSLLKLSLSQLRGILIIIDYCSRLLDAEENVNFNIALEWWTDRRFFTDRFLKDVMNRVSLFRPPLNQDFYHH